LLVEQEDKRVTLVVRNAFFLTMANLGFTAILMVAVLIIFVLSAAVTLLLALVTASLFAVMANRSVLLLLEKYRSQPSG
ncbi:MAG TPA: hypothetical protein VMP10_05365, partial [Chloroflexota bacterium]|nr:hypothetical protein [Chloroflexota bacterium]